MTSHALRRSPAWLALALLVAGCAAAPMPKPAPPVVTASAPAEPVREVLPNGVVLIAKEDRGSEVVAVQLWMRVGGRDEAPDELGLSHYLEHMLFKGTPARPPGSIDRLIEGLGGQSNAFTNYDTTHYDVVVPAQHVRAALELLADIAVNATFDQEELDRERQVVFEEMRLTQDNPDRFLIRRVYELGYEPHPYGRPLLGTRELIGSLTRERLRAYYKKRYVPANMAVMVVGAVPVAQAHALVADTFGRLAPGQAPRAPLPPLPALDATRRADVRRPEQQAYLGLAWRAPATSDSDTYAVDLLTYILGDSPSSRLNQAVRERGRLVFSIDADYGAWDRSGLVTVKSRLAAANLDAAEASILEVVRRVRAEGVTDAELRRALVTAESNYAFDIETAEGLAKDYGQAETTWTLADELAYLGRLRTITREQVQAAARKYLGDENYARVKFVPEARP
ncbi:MAG: insulinase family protein [Candidatus Rokubacteria bacterium]|nr:insulinase family protein [Candidatus Rokubacteria bacterium]